ANLGHLAQRRVRLLGRGGVHAGAHTAAERIRLERRRLLFLEDVLARAPDELIDRWHPEPVRESTSTWIAPLGGTEQNDELRRLGAPRQGAGVALWKRAEWGATTPPWRPGPEGRRVREPRR